jgi:two-component SAPR family response regulator
MAGGGQLKTGGLSLRAARDRVQKLLRSNAYDNRMCGLCRIRVEKARCETLKAVLVDDEPLALYHLETLLRECGGLEIVGRYQNPRRALDELSQVKPDVIFLDVEMPELNGIETAEQVLRLSPETDLVFVTAYDEYAVKAFELNALDYVLKPVQRDRLIKTVQRLIDRRYETHVVSLAGQAIMIRCFQSLQIEIPPRGPEPIRWRTAKAQELFAYLVHRRGQPVRKDALLELFWPDADHKKGFARLYTTIYQIRKTLKELNIGIHISNCDDGYLLDMKHVRVDVDEWERGIRMWSPVTRERLSEHLRLLELYRGDYLDDYDYIWAESERQRLRTHWFYHANHVAGYLESVGEYARALAVYHRIQRFHPHVEETYVKLMKLYDRLGDRNAVVREYMNLNRMLSEEYGVAPHKAVREWYLRWKKTQSR